MGLSCRPWGKFGSLMKKLDNEQKKEADAVRRATAKPKKEKKED